MSDNVGRIFGAIGALAALWIVAYWWWEPSHRKITLDMAGPSPAGAAIADPLVPKVVPKVAPPIAAPPSGEPPKLAVIPPRFRDYTIRNGDTMELIAERELGSRKMADALRSANALMDPEHLKVGRTIRIPLDPSNIQGKPVQESPVAAPAPAPPAQASEYTVKSGDTLSGIAKAQYGSTRFKDLIFEANRDRLASEDDVREGQKLRIPPKPR